MAFVLRCLEVVGHVTHSDRADPRGAYVARYDPEAHDGRGAVEWTDDPAAALRVPTARAALALLHAVPRARPRRDDGRPNRPLRAFTVVVAPAPD